MSRHGLMLVVLLAPIGADLALADRSEPDQARGKTIFTKHCSGCHGAGGQGDGYKLLGSNAADLTASRPRSENDLLRTIHEGKPGMPSWKTRLSGQDSRDVLAYIRGLSLDRKEEGR